MARWFGYVDDATSGGSAYRSLSGGPPPTIPSPTVYVPVTSAQADPGVNPADRNDEVRATRGTAPSFPLTAAPTASFSSRAYMSITRAVWRKAFGGTVTTTGSAPAAITSKIAPVKDASSVLPALTTWLVRENQVDRMTGAYINGVTMSFPIDSEASLDVDLKALYHDVDPASALALPTPAFTGYTDSYLMRDVTVFEGATPTQITCPAGFSVTFNNNLIDDLRSTHCAGRNVVSTTQKTKIQKVWYPDRHKLGAQSCTFRLDLGDVDAVRELERALTYADKIVVEAAGPAIGTTPPSNDLIRFTFYNAVNVGGGGADPLARDGDIVSSYEYQVALDSTGKDVEIEFVGQTAVT